MDDNGCFVVQARVRQDRTGRTLERTKTLPPNAMIEEALAARAKLVRDVREGNLEGSTPASSTTLTDYVQRWLERKVAEGLRDHTIDRYTEALSHHILPVLGSLYVDQIASRDILHWQDTASTKLMRNGKPFSRWSVNSWTTVLRSIVSDLVVEYELPRNPCHGVRGVKKPRSPRAMRKLNVGQMQEFLRLARLHCPQHHAIAMMLCLYGLRWEEASALHWKHVDEKAMELHVVQSQVRRKVYPTKNEHHKVLPLLPEVLDALKWERERLRVSSNPGLGGGLLFPGQKGEYRLPSSVSKAWKAVSKAMGLDFVVTPHDLRRSYQNLLRQASVNMVVQQALMGHSSDAMTQHYSHVDMEEKRAAQEKVISLLKFKEQKKEETA